MKKLINAVILAVLLIGIVSALTGSETMTRTAPSTVTPSSAFQVTYTAQSVSGQWFASLVDAVSGGCQFPAGTSLSTFMVSDEGTTKQVTVTAPSSGTCTFHGDYMYGSFPVKQFTDLTITISGSSQCTDTCSSLGFQCGDHLICSQSTNCGSCSTGQSCINGVCSSVCSDTCASKGFACGTQTICGQSTNCGTCESGKTCESGVCKAPYTPPSFDLNMVLFTLGTFDVTLLMVIVAGVLITIFSILNK